MFTATRRLLARLAPALGVLVAGCGDAKTATPLPEPPMMDLGGVSVDGNVSTMLSPAPVTFLGEPGSTAPGATVHVTNLETTDRVVATTAGADGGFAISILASAGDELRFQAIDDGLRSAPVDARLDSAFDLVPTTRPACVGVSPGYDLDFGGRDSTSSVTLTNSCGADITVSASRLRLGSSEFTPEAVQAGVLADGQSAARGVSFTKGTGVAPEDVLFVDVTVAGSVVRYPFTLH